MTKVIGSPDVSGSADAGFADTVLQGWGVRVTMRRVALSYRRMSIPAERWIADHASPGGVAHAIERQERPRMSVNEQHREPETGAAR
jgi:hypothetical protein